MTTTQSGKTALSSATKTGLVATAAVGLAALAFWGLPAALAFIALIGLGSAVFTLITKRPSWIPVRSRPATIGLAVAASALLLFAPAAIVASQHPVALTAPTATRSPSHEQSTGTARPTPTATPSPSSSPTPTSTPPTAVVVPVPIAEPLPEEPAPAPAEPDPAPPAIDTGGCDPNYSSPCVPIASDVDCAGGSGDGPAYVVGPVYVAGGDPYDLDRDGDGIGCD